MPGNVHLQMFLSIPVTQKFQHLSCAMFVANEPFDLPSHHMAAQYFSRAVPVRKSRVRLSLYSSTCSSKDTKYIHSETTTETHIPILFNELPLLHSAPGSVVGIVTGYGLEGSGIESRWGRDFPHLSRRALGPIHSPVQWVPGLSRVKERPGRDADPSPPSSAVVMKGWSYTSTPPMGRTPCTEPQCLYKGALYLISVPVQGCTLP